MRRPKANRQSPLKPEDLKRFPLPKHLFWMDLGVGQLLHPMFSLSGSIMATATAILMDRDFPAPDGGDIGSPGFHEENGGRWYRLDFPLLLPRRKCLRMVKRAVSVMEGRRA